MSDTFAIQLKKVAEADFPTQFGLFRIHGFEGIAGGRTEEAIALEMGGIAVGPAPLVRIHSQCLTGDVFHSLRCDCRAQLEIALRAIAQEGRGLLIYELQEGRGIGLLNKLRALNCRTAAQIRLRRTSSSVSIPIFVVTICPAPFCAISECARCACSRTTRKRWRRWNAPA